MSEYWASVPRPAGKQTVVEAAIARGRAAADHLVSQRDALFPPMRAAVEAGGKDALAIFVLQAIVDVLADRNSQRGRQHRPDKPLYHPLWEIMLLGGTDGMIACAFGVQLAVLQEAP